MVLVSAGIGSQLAKLPVKTFWLSVENHRLFEVTAPDGVPTPEFPHVLIEAPA